MRRIIAVVALLAAPLVLKAQTLEKNFLNPPTEARALMIWQWMDGVVSREGITADLEAYRAAGLGGVQQFQIGGPMQGLIRDTTCAIGSARWQELMAHAIRECRRLGLSFGTHNCPGWSSSAYPTVTPEYSMQKLVWTKAETLHSVPKGATVLLPRPAVDARWDYYEDIAVLMLPRDSIVKLDDIKVLPPRFLSDGETFEVPSKAVGETLFLRIGHTTNGKMNDAQAPYGGVGLECDKMSREAVARYWATYPAMLLDIAHSALGSDISQTFQRIEIDSYEAGGQEWTRRFPEEFRQRRGYDIMPWLATMTGVTIDSKERTAQFRKDYADTGCDLFAENYYGYMGELAHRAGGLRLLYQPYGTGGSKPFNPLDIWKITSQMKGDIICTEFWNKPDNWGWPSVPRHADVAHRQGLREVYAEAFTCWPLHAWKDDPARIKMIADRAFCLGVNRLMLHAGAHNPWPQAVPGMTFGKWGTQFTPGQTWWRSGGARLLFDYFARCQALLQMGDFVDDYRSKQPSLTADALQWTHRRTAEGDLYFISNPADTALTATVTLAATGCTPELWHPDTGMAGEASAWHTADGQTQVSLVMEAHEALFLVLRHEATTSGPGLALPVATLMAETPVTGSWTLRFPEGWGAPAEAIVTDLIPWNEHPDAGIRYFSGTARYTIDLPRVFSKGKGRGKHVDREIRHILDLGEVKNLARVYVNDEEVGHLWKPPFRCDITDYLRKGRNTLSIEVTNLWPNRMIGDEQWPDDTEWGEAFHYAYAPGNPYVGRFMKAVPQWLAEGKPRPVSARKTVVSFKFFEKDSPLLPSGLLGPVVIRSVRETGKGQRRGVVAL